MNGIEENLCLRLTQNFQFVNARGACDFPSSIEANKYQYKMAFRDLYSECKTNGIGTFETQTHFKYKNQEEIEETIAAFHYLLYNHHTRQFQAKTSQESRLFGIKKLKNLDIVQDSLLDAQENCIKLN
jgi:hypothetical protein